jgi:hypothetical protein
VRDTPALSPLSCRDTDDIGQAPLPAFKPCDAWQALCASGLACRLAKHAQWLNTVSLALKLPADDVILVLCSKSVTSHAGNRLLVKSMLSLPRMAPATRRMQATACC